MTKKEIKEYVESIIEFEMTEADLPREDTYETVITNALWAYDYDKITKDDLMAISDYLDYGLDINKVDEIKSKHQKSRAYQRELRARKRASRER